jgi:hypothetical protein
MCSIWFHVTMTRTFGKTKEDSDLFLNPTDTSNLYNYVLLTGLIIIILFKYDADNTSKLLTEQRVSRPKNKHVYYNRDQGPVVQLVAKF